MARKPSERQQRFVDEFLIDLCQTAAYVRAGYTGNPQKAANQVYNSQTVQAAIQAALAERSKRTGINQDRVIRELAKIAFLNPTDVINMRDATIDDEATKDDTAAIASVKVKIMSSKDGDITEREVKTYDKIKALELLGKHLGTFTEKIELDGLTIKVVLPSNLKEE